MNILGTGLSGLVGSRIVGLLGKAHAFSDMSLETNVDITKKEMVDDFFSRSDAPWVFHFAAYTDVQGAEKEKSLGESSSAWKVNVLATQNIVDNCKRYGKRLLYLDTDYAFDGTKREYVETDTPKPLGWYAKTKSEGAGRVLTLGERSLVLRISNPYRANPVGKKDFAHKMLEKLASGGVVTAPADQLFCPTFIDDIAAAISALTDSNAHGIYHAVGSSPLSPYDAALTIASEYKLDRNLVQKTTFREMFADRAPIPQYAVLSTAKLAALGITMESFPEGMRTVREQESGRINS